MTREENYYRTVEYGYPEYILCNVSLLPATWSKYRGELEDLINHIKPLPMVVVPQKGSTVLVINI